MYIVVSIGNSKRNRTENKLKIEKKNIEKKSGISKEFLAETGSKNIVFFFRFLFRIQFVPATE